VEPVTLDNGKNLSSVATFHLLRFIMAEFLPSNPNDRRILAHIVALGNLLGGGFIIS
jgi:hypothetical protein